MSDDLSGMVGCEHYLSVKTGGRSFTKRCHHCAGCLHDAALLTEQRSHPAKFSLPILEVVAGVLAERGTTGTVLDPMAGVGGIHSLAGGDIRTLGIELEYEWASQHSDTYCGDALNVRTILDELGVGKVQGIVVSPPYGNRMADQYVPKDSDDSRRFTYRLSLGREMTEGNSGAMQWGDAYRAFHRRLWWRCIEVLDIGAPMIVNCSDFIKNGKRVPVCGWHATTLIDAGMELVDIIPVATRRMKFGANAAARVDAELVMVFQ